MPGTEPTRPVRLAGLGEDGQYTQQDAVVVDLPLNNKFGFTWHVDPNATPAADRSSVNRTMIHTLSEGDSETSEDDVDSSSRETELSAETSPLTPTSSKWKLPPTGPEPPKYPTFSRAISMPLPSQLGHLQNPHKRAKPSSYLREVQSDPIIGAERNQFQELSMELADSVQTIVQTMLQISPAQLLDPAKEQFSACLMSVPTPSMSAMLTTMKNLNYISANMSAFFSPPESGRTMLDVSSAALEPSPMNSHTDFDIGELLQNVGDSLSGVAAQAGVDLVLYHGDVGLKHFSVQGDQTGLSCALSHIIRQVLCTAHRGDSIELGLFISDVPLASDDDPATVHSDDAERRMPSPVEADTSLRCILEISHMFTSSSEPSPADVTTPPIEARDSPTFSSVLLQRLLKQIDASLMTDMQPKGLSLGRTCQLTLNFKRSCPSSDATASTPADPSAGLEGRIAVEPTLDQLLSFSETLRGKKVTLYASSKGSFAHHLTSYLTAWGLDVSHVSAETELVEGSPDLTESASVTTSPETHNESLVAKSPPGLERYPTVTGVPLVRPNELPPTLPSQSSFVIIDDDVNVLRERLLSLRSEQPYNLNFNNARRRPSLAAHHRPRSSPHVARALGQPPPPPPPSSAMVLVHFTSLSNYKVIRDVIQSTLASYSGSSHSVPEILIIPKPAGPRRFLTALHTAVTKPLVDPFFVPIATSPMSPGLHAGHSFFHNAPSRPKSPGHRPTGSRSNSDRSQRSSRDSAEHANPLPPSPLGKSDSVEYFSEAAVQLGSSPSSGFVIQSPDGQPAGIFFHPRSKSGKQPAGVYIERGQPQTPHGKSSDRRISSSRRSSDKTKQSFSALHVSNVSPKTPSLPIPNLIDSSSAAAALAVPWKLPEDRSKLQVTAPILTRRTSPQEPPVKATSPPHSPLNEATKDGVSPTTRGQPSRRGTSESKSVTPQPKLPAKAPAKKTGKITDDGIVPPISVLVVDDNPINQTILVTFMKQRKIKYDVAKNGQEAVNKWRTGGFHLILMDIQMPIMDGIQATKEIRRLERQNSQAGYPPGTPPTDGIRTPLISTPSEISADARGSPYRSSVIIVALTASSLQSDRVAALAAGCNDFLTKPVSLVWLNSKIIEWGSIKALQMWADLRPEAMKTMSSGQAVKAQSVAERLHVPADRASSSPTASPRKRLAVPPTVDTSSLTIPAVGLLQAEDTPISLVTTPGSTTVLSPPGKNHASPDKPESTQGVSSGTDALPISRPPLLEHSSDSSESSNDSTPPLSESRQSKASTDVAPISAPVVGEHNPPPSEEQSPSISAYETAADTSPIKSPINLEDPDNTFHETDDSAQEPSHA